VHTVWNCGVCSKEFKSEKQLHNHEGSKKHKDAVKVFLKKGGVMTPSPPSNSSREEEVQSTEGEEEIEVNEVKAMLPPTIDDVEEVEADEQEEDHDEEVDVSPPPRTSTSTPVKEKTMGKAKAKRLSKLAKAANAVSSTEESKSLVCEVCFVKFSSRTKLFEHIKDEDHAIPVVEQSQGKGKKGKKNRG
jgi:DnaJ family protein A protein 5